MNLLDEMNTFLSDLAVFYRKLQNYHWNIKGNDFFVIHEKLEEYYDEINEQIDEIGESILILEGQPLATLKDYLEKSCIKEASNEKVGTADVLNNILKDFETLLGKAIKIKEMSDEQKQYRVSGIMDNYVDSYGKKIWMLKQSMQ